MSDTADGEDLEDYEHPAAGDLELAVEARRVSKPGNSVWEQYNTTRFSYIDFGWVITNYFIPSRWEFYPADGLISILRNGPIPDGFSQGSISYRLERKFWAWQSYIACLVRCDCIV